MSNPFSCTNQPPSYSGVTINITNPALNIPPTVQSCVSVPQYSSSQNAQNVPNLLPHKVSNSNDFAPYQIIPSDGNELMPAYPPQYYINSQAYPNGNPVNLLPQEKQDNSSQNSNKGDSALKEDELSTDTSKEIISELDERRAEEKELEKNGKKTKIISLTNEYIMSLENYLNNPNTDIRLMAAKEILTRLDEDKNRYDDAALNALLNKMLQDPNKLVRVAAMSAFTSELASGNDYTVELLNKIQQNPDSDPEDVLEASQILLKRAASTEVKYTQDNNQQKAENS